MELLTEELINLHDKHRMGTLSPKEQESLKSLLTNPGTKAAWNELERMAALYSGAPSEKLPEGFTENVMASIAALREAHKLAENESVPGAVTRPLPSARSVWRRAPLWVGAAAAGSAFTLLLVRLTPMGPILIGSPPSPGATRMTCRAVGALQGEKSLSLADLKHGQPAEILVETKDEDARVLQPAPEAQVCATRDANGCTQYQPLAGVVIVYQCRRP